MPGLGRLVDGLALSVGVILLAVVALAMRAVAGIASRGSPGIAAWWKHHYVPMCWPRFAQAFAGSHIVLVSASLLAAVLLPPATAFAAPSVYCPTLNATVANGGSVAIDVSACDGPIDGGMSGPIPPDAQHGTVTIGTNSGGTQFVTYAHSGDSATSDQFFLEDNYLGVVTVNITIDPPVSPITVSPGTLSAMTAGTAFSQALSASGGTAPYTYSLQSGSLPLGISLTSGGLC